MAKISKLISSLLDLEAWIFELLQGLLSLACQFPDYLPVDFQLSVVVSAAS
jgi:hypothetical protein